MKKNVHDVSNAINILDSTKATNNEICKSAYKHSATNKGTETPNMCGQQGSSDQSSSNKTGLSDLWVANASGTSGGGGFDTDTTKKVGVHTSTKRYRKI